jgi:hypothetical protein
VTYPAGAPRTRRIREPGTGYPLPVLTGFMHRIGLRGWQLHIASLASVAFCIVLWIRAKTVDQGERGNAERRALFAGLWAPTLWGIGNGLERHE